jgi:hypothetical protein
MGERSNKDDGGDDLAILFPDRGVVIAGVAVTMREFRWVEGLRLQSLIAPIVGRLADLAEQGKLMEAAALDALFMEQAEVLPLLIATACDQPVEWVNTLSDRDGSNLRLLWWTVNVPFFVPRVSDELQVRLLKQTDGPTSSPPSSPPATAHPISSGTPVGN